MALVSRARNQLQAIALRELLQACPLVLVYQTLGVVRSTDLVQKASAAASKLTPDAGVVARTARVKNTIAGAARSAGLEPFFQASNILLGWQPASSATALQQQDRSQAARSRRGDSLVDLMGDLAAERMASSAHASTAPAANPPSQDLPQRSLSVAIEASLRLPHSAPVALLAGFYRGQHVRMGHLEEWMKLDERIVYPQLVAQIDAAAEGVISSVESQAEALLGTLDAAQPNDLLACLDVLATQPCSAGGVVKAPA